MAGLWWIGMGGVALAVLMVMYFVWWVISKLFAPRTHNRTVVYLKTHKGLVRKDY